MNTHHIQARAARDKAKGLLVLVGDLRREAALYPDERWTPAANGVIDAIEEKCHVLLREADAWDHLAGVAEDLLVAAATTRDTLETIAMLDGPPESDATLAAIRRVDSITKKATDDAD